MIVHAYSRASLLLFFVLGVTFVLSCVLAGPVFGAEGWWRVSTSSAPASEENGEAQVLVEVSNVGDRLVEGLADPVKIVDRLPVGVSVSHVYPEAGGGTTARFIAHSEAAGSCTVVSGTVECSYNMRLWPYERFIIVLNVKVAPEAGNGVNEVSVSGGGVAPVVSRRVLTVGGPPAGFGVDTYEVTPENEGGGLDIQSGSHPFQLTTTLMLNSQAVHCSFCSGLETWPVALPKDMRFVLPPGLVGNPTPLPKCSMREFALASCSDNAAIGVVTTVSTATFGYDLKKGPLVVSWPLYSLEPSVGEPARFGFQTPAGPAVLDTSVRSGGDYGVVVTTSNITEGVGVIGAQVTFWGVPGDPRHDNSRGAECLTMPKEGSGSLAPSGESSCPVQEKGQPFLIMPTSCEKELRTTVEMDPWENSGVFTEPKEYVFSNSNGEPYRLSDCNQLSFEPSINVAPDDQQASTPTGLSVGVHVPQDASLNPTGRAESAVRDTTVALPAGVVLNPGGADGLESCSEEQIGYRPAESHGEELRFSPEPVACPDASKVGTVDLETPLLPNHLIGAAYLAQQNVNPFGSLIAQYIAMQDPVSGTLVKLAGKVVADEHTGQIVAAFKETPPLPFEDLKLHFFGGSRAPLGTPALCGPYTTTASITPWSGSPPVNATSTFLITSGPGGGPCHDPLPFAPSLTGGSTNIQAGAFTPFTTTMSREDGNQDLDAVELHTPPGLSGMLTGVELCPEFQANHGTCSANSLIGHTIVSVGLGGTPFTVTGGQVFITGPYKGAPFGLSIVNPAKAGPFDLGNVIVRAKIEVDPLTAALTVTTDTTGPYAIPPIIDGIPLQIKHVNVTIDRPGFTFNPTSCEPMQITGTITSIQGATNTPNVRFQVTNCATLKFNPSFNVTTSGHTSRAKGASLRVKLAYPKAPFGTQANIRKVKVDLPKQLPSRLTTLQKACPDSTFEQNPAACPPGSKVGTATTTTPIIPVPLSGPAYFVSHGGAKFPELIIVLSGYGVTVRLHGETFINKAGITSSTFNTVPDVPVGTFELNLPQATNSALAANGNLCTSTLRMPTAFTAANGATIHRTTTIKVTGCSKHKKPTKKKRHKKHK
jgi:hypothetical protein